MRGLTDKRQWLVQRYRFYFTLKAHKQMTRRPCSYSCHGVAGHIMNYLTFTYNKPSIYVSIGALFINVLLYRVLTMSSIFRILRTVSAASCIALVDTNNGWSTFSSRMLVMVP